MVAVSVVAVVFLFSTAMGFVMLYVQRCGVLPSLADVKK
jgi:hypothetical protein